MKIAYNIQYKVGVNHNFNTVVVGVDLLDALVSFYNDSREKYEKNKREKISYGRQGHKYVDPFIIEIKLLTVSTIITDQTKNKL